MTTLPGALILTTGGFDGGRATGPACRKEWRYGAVRMAAPGGQIRKNQIQGWRGYRLAGPHLIASVGVRAILGYRLAQHGERVAAVVTRECDQELVENLAHAAPGKRVLQRTHDHRVVGRRSIVADQQLLEEL